MKLKPATKNYKTELLTPDRLSYAALSLCSGDLVGFPTETVYGLGGLATNEHAVRKIFSTKGRPQDNPLIVHISREKMLEQVAQNIPDLFFCLQKRFWPGPLTCILPRHPNLPSVVSAGLSSVAVRMPAHPIALELIEAVGAPLVAPSANLSGRPSATTAQHVLEDFDGAIPYIIDGGGCALGIESTVVSLMGPIPVLLRPGSISKNSLEEAIGCEVGLPKKGEKALSPGMLHKHYAPKARVVLCFSQYEKNAHVLTKASRLILSEEPSFGERELNARTLYNELRSADQIGCEEVVIVCSERTHPALMDRIQRASGVIHK